MRTRYWIDWITFISFLFDLDPNLVANALDFVFAARYERGNYPSWLVIDGRNCLCGLCGPWFLSARQCDGSTFTMTDQVEAHQKLNWDSSSMETHATDAGDRFVNQWLHLLIALPCIGSCRCDQPPTPTGKSPWDITPKGHNNTSPHAHDEVDPILPFRITAMACLWAYPGFFSLLLLWHG